MKYIADTNVLLSNPEVIDNYDIIIPSHVNREIENLEMTRKQDRTLQWKIRRFKNKCDENDNEYINIKDYKFILDDNLDPQYTDNILIQIAHDEGYGIITNDILLRRKCREFGIDFINVNNNSSFVNHKGFKEVFLTKEKLSNLYQNLNSNIYNLTTNEYLIVYDDSSIDNLKTLDIFKWNGSSLIQLPNKKGVVNLSLKSNQFGNFKPRDAHQMIAVDSILNNQITQIRGRAGSGKSMISLETAWHLIEREGKSNGYERLVIFVNPTPAINAQELGFYTGDRLEKILQSSVGTMLKSKFGDELEIRKQIEDGTLDILPFVDLRGYETGDRKTILWILEAQNLTKNLMKMGLQRVSENTKVIIDGDYDAQVDKSIYATENGMKRVSEVFRGKDIYGEVELQNIYRSEVALIADKM